MSKVVAKVVEKNENGKKNRLWFFFFKTSFFSEMMKLFYKSIIHYKYQNSYQNQIYFHYYVGRVWSDLKEKKNPSEKETFITQFCSKFMIKSRLIFLWGLFHFSNFQLKLKRHSSANKISRLLFLTVNWSILIINQSMKSFWYCKTFDLTKKKIMFWK